ncbi:toprim domain-containing protein [Rhodoferax antarcticus]|uniref:Toprim domain-containing protein n=1 Tax=Rhodoferax antarcticus ANT.BR TaxID=1111071 RepID=A0A1Q8YAT6_9BURK|nr:toprim domain-containing protein [Rhodoferax antarcticus]APW47221.1 hypothetical protein RA876_13645 [Rhodoferax antarcticus]OLP05158.1 hypothetical protein BLL52_3979 [Rhodoferax antarcticus ANT.BR]
MTSSSASFSDAMAAAGLAPAKPLDMHQDGKIHRYRVVGDKSGSVNGWYSLHDGSPAFGAFGSWKTSESHTWHEATTRPQTAAERAEFQRQMHATRQAREAEQQAVYSAARDKAAKLWARAHPAKSDHPYPKRKQINPIGIRQLRDMLLVPVRDSDGTLHSIQFIGQDGTKRFLTGGRTRACYFSMGQITDTLLLAEGLATGCTLFMATRHAVAVTFSCGNLQPVAKALRAKFPDLKFVICADNDVATTGNPGVTAAREAARAVGGWLAVPSFTQEVAPCPAQ